MSKFLIPVVLAVLTASSVSAQQREQLRIGIVYREAASGHRMVSGIQEAVDSFPRSSDSREIVTRLFSYPYEQAGLRVLRDAIESGNVDVILGPTDTGVFLDLQEFQEVLDSQRVLILSPIVTADVGNDRNGWLFRTNVRANARARTIYDYLARRGFQSIAVVYEATGFGDRAEMAFRTLLSPSLSLRYRDSDEIRDLAVRIEAERPSAVGLFGSREHLRTLDRSLNEVKHGLIPYNPLLFTIVDASTLCLSEVLFISLSHLSEVDCRIRPREMRDELTDLGYDTAMHLLRVAGEVRGDPRTDLWRLSFREQLIASISRPAMPLARTQMVFSGMENRATPTIQVYRNNRFETVDNSELGWLGWIQSRLDVRRRRFGLMPLLNLGLVIGIVAVLSFLDVRKSHTGGWWRFAWRWTFLRLMLFNVLVAASVFVSLAEFGGVRWDNWPVALSVAVGYTMLLKTTIFETRAGQAIGLASFYEKVLDNIRRQLMVLRYELEGPRIYFLSYTNSMSWLQQVLRRVYHESEDTDRAEELMKRVDNDAEAAETQIGKRRVYAQILLDLMNWRQIVGSRLVPPNMKEYQLYNPMVVLREAAEHSTNRRPENKARIQGLVERHLEKRGLRFKKGRDPAREDLQACVAKSTSERGRTYHRLDWLVVQQVISIDQIWWLDFVERSYRPPLTGWSRFRSWVAKKLGQDDGLAVIPDAPARERRRTRRIPVEGEVHLSVEEKDDSSKHEWPAQLVDCGPGGARVFVANSAAPSPDQYKHFGLEIITGPLDGIKTQGDCRGVEPVQDGLNLSMEWVDPSEETVRQIANQMSPLPTTNETADVP